MDNVEFLKILGELGKKNYKEAFRLLLEKDSKNIQDKTWQTVWKKFTFDMKRLKERKKINEANGIIDSIIDLDNFPKEKYKDILNLGIEIYAKEDNDNLFYLIKKMLNNDKDNEVLKTNYIKILNELIEEKIKDNKLAQCKKLIEEEKNNSDLEDKRCFIYSLSALAFYEEGKYDESLKDAEESIRLYKLKHKKEDSENNEKEIETKNKMFETIILCFCQKYNRFVKEGNIEGADKIFDEYINKFSEQNIKNKFIDKCAIYYQIIINFFWLMKKWKRLPKITKNLIIIKLI